VERVPEESVDHVQAGASSFPVPRRVVTLRGERTGRVRLSQLISTKKKSGGTNRQDHFEVTDGIREYMRLIFDMFGETARKRGFSTRATGRG